MYPDQGKHRGDVQRYGLPAVCHAQTGPWHPGNM